MNKNEVLKIIDEVMNNREIDSIRNAILAIRDKVIDAEDDDFSLIKFTILDNCYPVKIPLRADCPIAYYDNWFKGAKYLVVDPMAKQDTGIYGEMYYE